MTTTLANEERFVEAMKDKFQPEGAIMVFDNTKDFEEFIKNRKDKIVTTIQYVNQEKYLDEQNDYLTLVALMKQAEIMATSSFLVVTPPKYYSNSGYECKNHYKFK